MKKKQTLREILLAQVGNGKTQFHNVYSCRYTGLDRLVAGELRAIADAMEKYVRDNQIEIVPEQMGA